jgi:anti-sigma regulatory factor (Ser/Thr protein kinase)
MADDAPTADTATPPSDVRWEKTYDGLPATVRHARRDVRAILGPCPQVVADDLELVVSELAANAIRHSRSGTDGGTYTVRVSHQATEKVPYVWVEVLDQGSPAWDGILRPEPAHGLSVVQHLSTWMGTDDEPGGRRTVYARLDYRADGTPLYGTGRVPELHPDLDGVRESDPPHRVLAATPSRKSDDMTAARCTCGFTELADEEVTDHLLQVFEPEDHTGSDGLAHEEHEPLTCECGFTASMPEELDAHFVKAFTPDDAIGRDGRRHEPVASDDGA